MNIEQQIGPILWVIVACIVTAHSPIAIGHKTIPADQEVPLAENSVDIEPAANHELCLDLLPNATLAYSFESSQSLEFNLHYHKEAKLAYPVFPTEKSYHEGIFFSEKANEYCLMWINRHQSTVTLGYGYSVQY